MYAYISGKLEGVAEDAVIIDNHGIGYQPDSYKKYV